MIDRQDVMADTADVFSRKIDVRDSTVTFSPSGLSIIPPSANTSGILPFDKRVLVLHDPVSDTFEGTSLLRPDAEKDKQKYAQTRATVIAVGDAAWAEAKYDARQFGISATFPEPGSRVLVGRYTGDTHKGADGTNYVVLNDTDIIAFLQSEGGK